MALCCVLLTGLRGGRDLMKSRMISCALFFNLGGMSPFTWNDKDHDYKKIPALKRLSKPVEGNYHCHIIRAKLH